MANTLILNQNQVFNGLGTLTYTVATTGNYNVQVQTTVPSAPLEGDGAGSNTGLGAGKGGGTVSGFARGGAGTGNGATGQGFGSDTSGYNQPIASGSNESTSPAISSGLSIVINDNGSPIFTAPVIGQAQSSIQFKYSFQATATHVITVVLASSTASDNQLSGITSNVSIGEGF